MRIQRCLCVFNDAFFYLFFFFRSTTPSLKYLLIGFNHKGCDYQHVLGWKQEVW